MNKIDSPLDLTVHRRPANGASALDASHTRMGRWKMLLVLAACAAPVVASYLTYYVIKPTNIKSFGELVQPQRPMPSMTGTTLDGRAVPLQSLRGQWLLVSVSGGACDEQCQHHLYVQRQLRETLGKDKNRLDWVWFITDNAPLEPKLHARLADPQLAAQGFWALRISESELAAWLQPLPDKVSEASLAARLYLIDPQGNYMMRFPEKLTLEGAAKAKADINKLLRAASFWDTPGRDNLQADHKK